MYKITFGHGRLSNVNNEKTQETIELYQVKSSDTSNPHLFTWRTSHRIHIHTHTNTTNKRNAHDTIRFGSVGIWCAAKSTTQSYTIGKWSV